MMTQVDDTIKGADLLLFLLDASRGPDERDREIAALLPAQLPVILVFNKIDLLPRPLDPGMSDGFRQFPWFCRFLAVSAKLGEGTDDLLAAIWSFLSPGPALFPEEMFTDQTERFLAAEMVREKIILLTREEIPYATAVAVEVFQEDEKRNFIKIMATIMVEKESQKRIVIGQGGRMIKEIGRQARLALEDFFAAKIYLELFVRVQKDWTDNPRELRKLGYQ
jgi:GTP-binding protein Era